MTCLSIEVNNITGPESAIDESCNNSDDNHGNYYQNYHSEA